MRELLRKAKPERLDDLIALNALYRPGPLKSGMVDDFIERISDQTDDQKTRINKANTSIDEQIAAIERHLEQRRALMESAFIQMENAQSKIQRQQSALNGMMNQSSS